MPNLKKYFSEDFGSSHELSSTGYWIFGILTCWIYTVTRLHQEIKFHFDARYSYFTKEIKQKKIKSNDLVPVDSLLKDGFSVNSISKNIIIFLYSLAIVALFTLIAGQKLFADNIIKQDIFYGISYLSMGIVGFALSSSTIIFLCWFCKTLKGHEYSEDILGQYIYEHNTLSYEPTKNFITRWNTKQNTIGLFLVLAVSSSFIPLKGVYELEKVAENGSIAAIGQTINLWAGIAFVLAGIFHFWGTEILLKLFNDHTKWETETRSILEGENSPGIKLKGHSNRENQERYSEKNHDPKRYLTAIMLTDMVGYSKDMERSENKAYSKLIVHNEIIRRNLSRFNGKEIKTIGDAFLVRFHSAVDAVKAGQEIQNQLHQYNLEKQEDNQIWIRVGIHLGDIIFSEDDVFGSGVNIAARIEPLADPGGICISGEVYNVVKKSIEIKVLSLGRKELKNIKDSPEIYKILIDEISENLNP